MHLIVRPAQGASKIHVKAGKLLMYIAEVNLRGDTVTITPRLNITDAQLENLKVACTRGGRTPCNPERWKHGPDGGWTTHVSVPAPFRERPLGSRSRHRVQIRRLLCPVDHGRAALTPTLIPDVGGSPQATYPRAPTSGQPQLH